MRPLSHLLATLQLVPLLPPLAFFAVVVTAPPTLSGLGYAVALLLLGASRLPRDAWWRRAGRRGALALFALTVIGRIVMARGDEHAQVRLRSRVTEEAGAPWLDRLVDEQDLAVNAARALRYVPVMADPDVPALASVMRASYEAMRQAVGAAPSPVLGTYASILLPGEQRGDGTIEMGDVEASRGVVVFLHGFAGSFTLPCWVVARAAAAAGYATVCPSTRWVGDWWSPAGEASVRDTVLGLRKRGARHLVLAGLSNGGVGASLLLPRMRGVFEGLVLVSGASPDGAAPGVPTLVVHGERDAQISARVARAYADRVDARYLSLDAGHFALLLCEHRAAEALTSFLRALPNDAPAASEVRRR